MLSPCAPSEKCLLTGSNSFVTYDKIGSLTSQANEPKASLNLIHIWFVFQLAKITTKIKMACSKLSANDRASERLLNTIAEHVDPDKIRSIATDLNMKDATCSHIIADNKDNKQQQAFRVG